MHKVNLIKKISFNANLRESLACQSQQEPGQANANSREWLRRDNLRKFALDLRLFAFKKVLSVLTILFIIFVVNLYCADLGFSQAKRNPFKDWFPVIKIEPKKVEDIIIKKRVFDSSPYKIEGLIWGTDKPKVIINNKIYGIADKLGEADIIRIDKEGVAVLFDGQEYVIKPRAAIKTK